MSAAGSIRSTNYSPGVSGYSIDGDGSAEFNNVTARGHIEATSGTFAGELVAETTDVSQGGDLVLRPEGFFSGGSIEWRDNADGSLSMIEVANVPAGGDMRVHTNELYVVTGGADSLRVRNAISSGQTALELRMVTPAGGVIFRTVELGPPDSYTPGYRALFVSSQWPPPICSTRHNMQYLALSDGAMPEQHIGVSRPRRAYSGGVHFLWLPPLFFSWRMDTSHLQHRPCE